MEQETYVEDLVDLVENALAPLEKYFASLVDIGSEDQEPRRVFIDDVGKTGLGLVAHAQDEIRGVLEHVYQRIGRVGVKRAAYANRMGLPPRKVIDIELASSDEEGQGWARH